MKASPFRAGRKSACDPFNIYDKVRSSVMRRIIGLKRTKDGWEKL
ncbi:hypothetical protein IC007_0867 [Sulfuracidifex tepidarius]|uniref:Uncharacterized protein n=1 Tax=Sulfuracidifex tepidarius TaxID=1294262 RepID=A0A510E1J0_9CREN|nr:hypothetical protein IC007_0867 [Sulfuracidifex tepidarius]